MRRLRLYMETSVFGFYYDALPHNAQKRQATRLLFDQVKLGIMDAFVSPTTLAELGQTERLDVRRRMFALIDTTGMIAIQISQAHRREIFQLAHLLVSRGAIPENKFDDAVHVATLAVIPGLDVLVTWNCTHLANVLNRRRLASLMLEQGYPWTFEIATPEEVVDYEA